MNIAELESNIKLEQIEEKEINSIGLYKDREVYTIRIGDRMVLFLVEEGTVCNEPYDAIEAVRDGNAAVTITSLNPTPAEIAATAEGGERTVDLIEERILNEINILSNELDVAVAAKPGSETTEERIDNTGKYLVITDMLRDALDPSDPGAE